MARTCIHLVHLLLLWNTANAFTSFSSNDTRRRTRSFFRNHALASDGKEHDMNAYNLPSLEAIAEEWTAVVKAGSSLQTAGVFMEPKNTKVNFADLITVRFPRTAGLGLELLELAGGREDGVGVTIVEAVVPGGPADGSGILPGDTLVDVAIESSSSNSDNLDSSVTIDSIQLECLGFDATVEALQSLPSPNANADETFVVSVKRLRKRPKVKVNLQYPDDEEPPQTIEIFCGENLRRALLVRGVKLNDPLAQRFDSGGSGDCGADGTCATCAVAVTKGADLLTPRTTMEEQVFKNRVTWRMSCKAKLAMKEGELNLRVNPRQWD